MSPPDVLNIELKGTSVVCTVCLYVVLTANSAASPQSHSSRLTLKDVSLKFELKIKIIDSSSIQQHNHTAASLFYSLISFLYHMV